MSDLTPQPAPDERTETVARVLWTRDNGAVPWDRANERIKKSYRYDAGEIEDAVVAALDDESARLRYVESDLAYAREAGESYRRQRDAARAALDRVRAEMEMVRGYAALDFATAAGVVLLLDKFAEALGALDPEEPR